MSEEKRGGWFSKLRSGLGRSSSALRESITGIFVKKKLDEEALEELEDALIMADLGVDTARAVVAELAKGRFGKELTDDEVRSVLAQEIAKILEPAAVPLPHRPERRPQVVLVAGVNGVGKTTTIGKLAEQNRRDGRSVMLAAGDTFRAAAVEQLQVWGERAGVPVISGKPGCDAAGLAYDALERAQRENVDLLFIDTAGRLHNKSALMAELQKVVRVLHKLDEDAPHDVLLVLDATTGQNAHNQVSIFDEMLIVTGLIVTKLDGTAKGGVVIALAKRFGLPVHAIGVGEGIEDLRPFEATAFSRALLGLEGHK
ncbi:MAG: signal recognition particle-docking protein FtsY [Pseudomonadota bacterium]